MHSSGPTGKPYPNPSQLGGAEVVVREMRCRLSFALEREVGGQRLPGVTEEPGTMVAAAVEAPAEAAAEKVPGV